MSAAWMADQLRRMSDARHTAMQIPRFNPRPAGVIRPGSATDVVLVLLTQRRVFMNFAQIKAQSGCTKASIDFALRYLATQKHIETIVDGARNPRYQRYRVTDEGIKHVSNRS